MTEEEHARSGMFTESSWLVGFRLLEYPIFHPVFLFKYYVSLKYHDNFSIFRHFARENSFLIEVNLSYRQSPTPIPISSIDSSPREDQKSEMKMEISFGSIPFSIGSFRA